MSIAELPRLTAEGLLSIAEDKRYELVEGQLVERRMSQEAGWIAVAITTMLRVFLLRTRLGDVFSEASSYQCFPHEPETVRRPEGSVILKGRLPHTQFHSCHVRIRPDLVIEIISPNDLSYDVAKKLDDYFQAQIPLVWQINPATRTVTVYADGGNEITHLHESDELTGGAILPGFLCRVAEIFPPREEFPAQPAAK